MKRPFFIVLAIAAIVGGLVICKARLRDRAEAELWAAATDDA